MLGTNFSPSTVYVTSAATGVVHVLRYVYVPSEAKSCVNISAENVYSVSSSEKFVTEKSTV